MESSRVIQKPTPVRGVVGAPSRTRWAIGIDTSPAALSLTGATTLIPGLPYSYFKVSGTYRFHSLTPLVSAIMGDPILIQIDTSALVG